jgi:hypothetical protein
MIFLGDLTEKMEIPPIQPVVSTFCWYNQKELLTPGHLIQVLASRGSRQLHLPARPCQHANACFTWGPRRPHFPHLPHTSLHSHMHARGPSSYKQVVVASGSHYNIQTPDLLLQHPDETFVTYVKNR